MNKKIKKIIATSVFSVMTLGAIGCGSANSKLAKNIDKGMADFINSINSLDYVDTKAPQGGYGKIVETATISNDANFDNFNNNINNIDVENTITKPSERTDNFKLYVLSESPYISLSSDDNNSTFEINAIFSTEKIESKSDDISEQINSLILKRSILMIYVNELYNGHVNISEENKTAINAYVNVIKENASYLKGNRGMVKNQLKLANDLITEQKNNNLVNYYMIKSGEALETRSNKIESTISAIDSIISIIENNLQPSSSYYNTKLSTAYETILNNIKDTKNGNENQQLASNIANSLEFGFIDKENANSPMNKLDNSTSINQQVSNSTDDNNIKADRQVMTKNVEKKQKNLNDTKNLTNQNTNNTTNSTINNENYLKQENNKDENINTVRTLPYDNFSQKSKNQNTNHENNNTNNSSKNVNHENQIKNTTTKNKRRAVRSVNGFADDNSNSNKNAENAKLLNQNEMNKNGYNEITMKADRTKSNISNLNNTRRNSPMKHDGQNIVRVPYEITSQD